MANLRQAFDEEDNFDDEFENEANLEDLQEITEQYRFQELEGKIAEALKQANQISLKE
jgi:hypothetical protein